MARNLLLNMNPQIELPKYVCNKKVWALKIKGISLDGELAFEDSQYGPRIMDKAWLDKHNPEVGGYLVQYDRGYISYSPAEAFESGYIADNLVWYGPHACQTCELKGIHGTNIVKAGNGAPEDLEYDFGQDSHYPNHVWKKHMHA